MTFSAIEYRHTILTPIRFSSGTKTINIAISFRLLGNVSNVMFYDGVLFPEDLLRCMGMVFC